MTLPPPPKPTLDDEDPDGDWWRTFEPPDLDSTVDFYPEEPTK